MIIRLEQLKEKGACIEALDFMVEEDLIFIKVGKQRGGLPSGKIWMCKIDFNKNVIAPITNERNGL